MLENPIPLTSGRVRAATGSFNMKSKLSINYVRWKRQNEEDEINRPENLEGRCRTK